MLHAASDPETCGAKAKPVIKAYGVCVHSFIVAYGQKNASTVERFFGRRGIRLDFGG
jgi:hypothetical protein